ncbi:hypothetical protein [Dankookia sp. P2]|uniref:hypothetical protein n=1 Tax=Dankookia sp. P2 TaxID=3423955 RepID=UPI003D6664FC
MIAAHADWSIDPRKRWITWARRRNGQWRAVAPAPVGDLTALLPRLLAPGLPVALGLDLPLGVPREFAAGRPEPGFAAFLRGLAGTPDFFTVSPGLETVSPARPFYPARGIAGMTRAAHAAALGLSGPIALSRWCDRATAERPAGAPLFWTLGANQSGKAAITAWRDWIVPALAAAAPIRLWPFEGAARPAGARHCSAGRGLSGRGAAALRAGAGRQQAGPGAASSLGTGAAGGDGGARSAARPRAGRHGRRRLRRRCRRGGPLRQRHRPIGPDRGAGRAAPGFLAGRPLGARLGRLGAGPDRAAAPRPAAALAGWSRRIVARLPGLAAPALLQPARCKGGRSPAKAAIASKSAMSKTASRVASGGQGVPRPARGARRPNAVPCDAASRPGRSATS